MWRPCSAALKYLLRRGADVEAAGAAGRGLHSSTSQLNVSAFCGIGGAFRGCLSGVEGVFVGGEEVSSGVGWGVFVSETARVELKSERVKAPGGGHGTAAHLRRDHQRVSSEAIARAAGSRQAELRCIERAIPLGHGCVADPACAWQDLTGRTF